MNTEPNTSERLQLHEGDYDLIDGAAWLTVKQFAIRIAATDEGVVVDIYRDGHEMEESLGSTYAFDNDCVETIEPDTEIEKEGEPNASRSRNNA